MLSTYCVCASLAAALQAWLEVAWADGFDPPGCESLGGRVLGTRKWIGTTEVRCCDRRDYTMIKEAPLSTVKKL
jgi:hypothetical protein